MSTNEKYELLTSGSNWFNPKTEKLVTVLFTTNQNVNAKFAEHNPPQVVFLTASNAVVSVEVEKFLAVHEFYNIQPEVEQIIESLLSGVPLELDEDEEDADADADADEDDNAESRVYNAKLSKPVDIKFHTVEGDNRQPPLMTNDLLLSVLTEVSAEPIVVHKDFGLFSAGTKYNLVFLNAEPALKDLLVDAFDPSSASQNYAGFTLNNQTVQIDTFLGVTDLVTRSGSMLIVNLAQLDEEFDSSEDDPESHEAEEEPAVEAPKQKTFAELAREMQERTQEASAESPAEVEVEVGVEDVQFKPDSAPVNDGAVAVTIS